MHTCSLLLCICFYRIVRRFLALAWSVAELGSRIFSVICLHSADRLEDLSAGENAVTPDAQLKAKNGAPSEITLDDFEDLNNILIDDDSKGTHPSHIFVFGLIRFYCEGTTVFVLFDRSKIYCF
jgi:hypothetical protein